MVGSKSQYFFARREAIEERERAWAKWEDEFFSQKYALPLFRSAIQFCNNDDSSLRMQMMMSVAWAKKNEACCTTAARATFQVFISARACTKTWEEGGGHKRKLSQSSTAADRNEYLLPCTLRTYLIRLHICPFSLDSPPMVQAAAAGH